MDKGTPEGGERAAFGSGSAVGARMLMRLRHDAKRRSSSDDAHVLANSIAALALSCIGTEPDDYQAGQVLRAVAVALVATRQSFMATRDLSDIGLSESMPAITHLSRIAESLVALADECRAAELDEPLLPLFNDGDPFKDSAAG